MLRCASKPTERDSTFYKREARQICGLGCFNCVSVYSTLSIAAIVGATKIAHGCRRDLLVDKETKRPEGGGEKPPPRRGRFHENQ
jgi:hypothetical protein